MKTDLLIACATEHEMDCFLQQFPAASKKRTKGGQHLYTGLTDQKTYHLLITGPGTFNAAGGMAAYLEQHTPALILQTGIGGVFEQTGKRIADVAVAGTETYIHSGVKDELGGQPLPFEPVKNQPETKKGVYSFDDRLVNLCQKTVSSFFLGSDTAVFTGGFITVSSISGSNQTADERYKKFAPEMEAMEGAACAHIALQYNLPMVEIRSASNFVGERDKTKWDISKAARRIPAICRAAASVSTRLGFPG